MKVRQGFVTNSSSSSFLLAFNSKDTIKEELYKENPHISSKYLDIIALDAMNSDPKSYDDMVSYTRKYLDLMCDMHIREIWIKYYCFPGSSHGSYSEYINWKESHPDEYNGLVNKYIDYSLAILDAGTSTVSLEEVSRKYLVLLSYSNIMEYKVLPAIEQVVMDYNHH